MSDDLPEVDLDFLAKRTNKRVVVAKKDCPGCHGRNRQARRHCTWCDGKGYVIQTIMQRK